MNKKNVCKGLVYGLVFLLCASFFVSAISSVTMKNNDKVSTPPIRGETSNKPTGIIAMPLMEYWASNGLDIYNTNNGSVGINTVMPKAKLDVEGSIYVLGGSGDVNGNGVLTGLDALYVNMYVQNAYNLTPSEYARADITGDGRVTYLDAQMIQQVVVGMSIDDAHRIGKQIENSAFDISYNGNIGVNKTNSVYKFDVNGNLHANDYYSDDGSKGITTSGNNCVIKSIKNGLIINATC